MERTLKRAIVIATVCAALIAVAQGQNVDFAFGAGTVTSPSSLSAEFNTCVISLSQCSPQSVGGGTFLNFSGDFLLRHRLGVQGEVAWRATQGKYFAVQPFRPIFYDFNGIYAPNFGKHFGAELLAGIGAQSTRFYTNQVVCSFTSCTNYTSSNHFMGHFGGGLRLYPFGGGFFIRPEAHVYLVHNNFEFNSNHPIRVGASIGYSLGER